MDENSYNLVGSSEAGNREQDIKNPSLGWIFAFMFSISFVGIFSLIPLRKVGMLWLAWSSQDPSFFTIDLLMSNS
jgi:hypothetical protein